MLYYVAFGLAMSSADVGARCEHRRADMPMNPNLLRAISGLAGIVATVLFVYGFWLAWYAPFIALGVGLAFTVVWHGFLGRPIAAPLFSIVTGLMSAALSVMLFFA